MGNNICRDDNSISKQNIQGILIRIYDIMTSDEGYIHRVKCIEELVHRYHHLSNPHYIYRMIPMKSPDGLESLLLQATIGDYAIDMYLFYDTIAWQTLIYPAPYRSYKSTNWLSGSITMRKDSHDELYHNTSKRIDRRYKEHDYYNGYASISDIRFTPRVEILSPQDIISAYDTCAILDLEFHNFTLESNRFYTVQVNRNDPVIINNDEPVQINLKEGIDDVVITIILYSENKTDIGYAATVLQRSYELIDVSDQLCDNNRSNIID